MFFWPTHAASGAATKKGREWRNSLSVLNPAPAGPEHDTATDEYGRGLPCAGGKLLVRNTPLDAVTVIELARSTYRKMAQNLAWATGYNAFAIPLAAGALYPFGIVLTPAAGAVLMSASTAIVAINSRFLKIAK